MNLYEVVSEVLEEPSSMWAMEPPEKGCIWRLIAARNRSQARYLAWKTDRGRKSFQTFSPNDITAIPRFRVRKIIEGLKLNPGDYTA